MSRGEIEWVSYKRKKGEENGMTHLIRDESVG